jgi:hypothetical protein
MKAKDTTKNIQLNLNFEEVNILLKALGQLPFNEVYDLIGKIHDQANEQAK